MSTIQIPVLKFLFTEQLNVLDEALAINPDFQVDEYSSPNDLTTFLTTIPGALIMVRVKDKSDLLQLANLVKGYKTTAKKTAVKVVVFQFFKDKDIEKAISKLGILDVIQPNIQTKALKYKFDFWIKALKGQIRHLAKDIKQAQKNAEPKSEKSSQDSAFSPTWIEGLNLENDIWLTKNDYDCKRVLSKWLVKLIGPGPAISQWTEIEKNLWKFEIKETEKEQFIAGDGDWYFSGDQKPDYIWKENVWIFTGEKLDLYFRNAMSSSSRMKSEEKSLSICKNSIHAKNKKEIILESFDKEMVFRKEATTLNDLDGKGSTDNLGGPLSGHGATDEITHGHLSGSINSSEERTKSHYEGNVLGFTVKAREKESDPSVDAITQDAKIESYITVASQKIPCSLDDFFDGSVFFYMDEDESVTLYSNLSAYMTYKTGGKVVTLNFEGRVESIDSDGDGKMFVSVSIGMEKMRELESFMTLFQDRQRNVNEFMKMAKGL